VIVVRFRRPNTPEWGGSFSCQTRTGVLHEMVWREVAYRNECHALDIPYERMVYAMEERCDVCGKEITEENKGQSTEEGTICKDCLERRR
jgi:hypothetical protein